MASLWRHLTILLPHARDILAGMAFFWIGYRSEASKNASPHFRLRNTVVLLLLSLALLACEMTGHPLTLVVLGKFPAADLLLLAILLSLNDLKNDLAALRARGSRYPEFEDGPDREQVRRRLSMGDYLFIVENHRILVGKRGRLASFVGRMAVPMALAVVYWALRFPDILCLLPLGWILGMTVRQLRLRTMLAFHGMEAVVAGQAFGEVDAVDVIVTTAAGKHRVCLTIGYGSQRRNTVLMRLDDLKMAHRLAEVVRNFMDAQTDPAFRPPLRKTPR